MAERIADMAIFVFCVNLTVAAFLLTTAVEISTLLIGGIVWALEKRVDDGT